jgi:rhamnosyltransferase
MTPMPKIVILLAAYNGEKWIEQQIATILNQKDVDLYLYISVDISTDRTYKIVYDLSQNYSNIVVLPYGRRFGGAAPNFYRLLLEVPIENYDYVAFSDQDDIWLEEKLINAIDILERENAFGYSSDLVAFWENGKRKYIKKSFPQVPYDFLFESPGPGCTFVLKRQFVLSLREYLKLYIQVNDLDWHDWIVYAYARTHSYKWIIDESSYIMYRQHKNNQLGVNAGVRAFFNRVKNIYSGYGITQSIKIIRFLHLENDLFIARWLKNNRIRYMTLAVEFNKCRRKSIDKIFYIIACITMSVVKPKIVW